MMLGGAAAACLGALLVFFQPRLDEKLLGRPSIAAVARAFLSRALAMRSASDVAVELDAAAKQTLGVERTLLIIPSPDAEQGIAVLGGDGDESPAVGDAEKAFQWLGASGVPWDLASLGAVRDDDGARATLDLLERLRGHVVLPLRHRGLLLGLAVLSEPTRPTDGSKEVAYRSLGAHATVALANTYLDADARGQTKLSKAFDLATAIQEALLPEDRTLKRAGFQFRGLVRAAAECGGDLWIHHDLGQGRLLLVIGDATGHGAAPAMLTAVAKGTVEAMRQAAGADLDPARLLSGLNRAIHRAGRTRYLMTAFAAVLDSHAGTVRFANAGQNFPYLIPGDVARRLEQLVARGNTLGAEAEAAYTTQSRAFQLGDRLVLYTDGLVDAGSPYAEPFGEKRFRSALMSMAETPAPKLPAAILSAVDRYMDGRPIFDDVTVVAAEVLPPEADSGTEVSYTTGPGGRARGGTRP